MQLNFTRRKDCVMVHPYHSKHIYSDEAHEEEPEAPRLRGKKEWTSEEHNEYDMTEAQKPVYPP